MKCWADCQLQNMIFRSKEWHEDGCSASLHLKLTISLFDLSFSEVQPFNLISLPAVPPCQAKKSQMAVKKSKNSDWICRKGSILQNDLSVFTPCVAVKVWCSLLAPEHLCHTGLELQKAPQRCLTSPPLRSRTGYSRFSYVSHVFYLLSSPPACCLAGCCSGAFQRYRSVIPHSETFILFR